MRLQIHDRISRKKNISMLLRMIIIYDILENKNIFVYPLLVQKYFGIKLQILKFFFCKIIAVSIFKCLNIDRRSLYKILFLYLFDVYENRRGRIDYLDQTETGIATILQATDAEFNR